MKDEALALRNRLLHYRFCHFFEIKTDTSVLMDDVEPRLNQTAYGYGKRTSPAIDSLALEAGVFEQCFSTASYTIASFASINTSLYPASHGLRQILKDEFPPRAKTIAQILSAYGYTTAWFGPRGDPHLSALSGIDRGFGEARMEYFPATAKESWALRRWLRRHRREKFFLNFHTYRVHAPWLPGPKYRAMFVDPGEKNPFPGPQDRDRYFHWWTEKNARNAPPPHPDTPKLQQFGDYPGYWSYIDFSDPRINAHVQGLYDACLLEYDQEVLAPVIAELKALGLYDRTIIIVVADHGEEFYEHKGFNHGLTLYDEVVRVPLIIRVPGAAPHRVTELAQTVDILPTLLGLLRIPVPQQAQGKDWSVCLTQGACGPQREYAYAQNFLMSSLRSKEWKVVRHDDGTKELYDLKADPRELTDLSAERPDVCARLDARLSQWEAGLTSYVDRESQYPPWVTEEMRRKIRRTGYF
jgi:arylsulfatase A-like enzyme